MVNKQGLWFLVLFSLILVLSVYYITMPNELFLTNNGEEITEKVDETVIEEEESEILTAMQVELDGERDKQIASIKESLNDSSATAEVKNNAYEELIYLNELKGIEENIESKIKKEFGLSSFVKVTNSQVSIVIVKENHDATLANDIIRLVQKQFEDKMYITVKFEK